MVLLSSFVQPSSFVTLYSSHCCTTALLSAESPSSSGRLASFTSPKYLSSDDSSRKAMFLPVGGATQCACEPIGQESQLPPTTTKSRRMPSCQWSRCGREVDDGVSHVVGGLNSRTPREVAACTQTQARAPSVQLERPCAAGAPCAASELQFCPSPAGSTVGLSKCTKSSSPPSPVASKLGLELRNKNVTNQKRRAVTDRDRQPHHYPE
ncbi:hypothetical protein EYF80_005127 [Liparis tanakae]|uniref:Uncharacterized protein n=1 Tax=Liparis tanakae TaxID=230148 RepID=A0A4Z2J5E9_9TELE|nr:hypothetical protein EYF80_005127 [Liparis tanakae]